MKRCFLMLVAFVALSGSAKDFVGLWTTVDDETKEKKSVVRIYRHGDRYFGRIVNLFKNKAKTRRRQICTFRIRMA